MEGENKIFCNLNFIDACKIYKCVTNIQGFKSSSSSPTDTWALFFAPETTYKAGNNPTVEISRGFLKFFFTPRSWLHMLHISKTNPRHKHADTLEVNTLRSLEYERRFYNWIIKPILDNEISPHFIRYFSGSTTCTYDNLLKILETTVIPNASFPISSYFIRNLAYMFKQEDGRPSISDPITDEDLDMLNELMDQYPMFISLVEKAEFSFILTQYAEPDITISLYEYFKRAVKDLKDFKDDAEKINNIMKDLTTILFQVAQGCYAMHSVNAIHNDLHAGNVLVTSRPCGSNNVKYVIPDTDYPDKNIELTFKDVSLCARIFDFDRSYAEVLGDNPNLEGFCDYYSQCNEVVDGKDFAKIICYLTYLTGNTVWLKEIHAFYSPDLYKDPNVKQNPYIIWRDAVMLQENSCHFHINSDEPLSSKQIETNILSYPQILKNLYTLYKSYGGKEWLGGDQGQTFVCPGKIPLVPILPDIQSV